MHSTKFKKNWYFLFHRKFLKCQYKAKAYNRDISTCYELKECQDEDATSPCMHLHVVELYVSPVHAAGCTTFKYTDRMSRNCYYKSQRQKNALLMNYPFV